MRVLMIALLCATVASFGIGFVLPPQASVPSEAPTVKSVSSVDVQLHASARLGKLLNVLRHESDAARTPAPEVQQAAAPAAPVYDVAQSLRQSLRAVVQDETGSPAVLLSQRAEAPRRVVVGDDFERGWSIAEISTQAVTLKRGRERVRVGLWSLASAEKPSQAPDTSAAAAQKLQGAVDSTTQSASQTPRLLLSRPGSRRTQ